MEITPNEVDTEKSIREALDEIRQFLENQIGTAPHRILGLGAPATAFRFMDLSAKLPDSAKLIETAEVQETSGNNPFFPSVGATGGLRSGYRCLN